MSSTAYGIAARRLYFVPWDRINVSMLAPLSCHNPECQRVFNTQFGLQRHFKATNCAQTAREYEMEPPPKEPVQVPSEPRIDSDNVKFKEYQKQRALEIKKLIYGEDYNSEDEEEEILRSQQHTKAAPEKSSSFSTQKKTSSGSSGRSNLSKKNSKRSVVKSPFEDITEPQEDTDAAGDELQAEVQDLDEEEAYLDDTQEQELVRLAETDAGPMLNPDQEEDLKEASDADEEDVDEDEEIAIQPNALIAWINFDKTPAVCPKIAQPESEESGSYPGYFLANPEDCKKRQVPVSRVSFLKAKTDEELAATLQGDSDDELPEEQAIPMIKFDDASEPLDATEQQAKDKFQGRLLVMGILYDLLDDLWPVGFTRVRKEAEEARKEAQIKPVVKPIVKIQKSVPKLLRQLMPGAQANKPYPELKEPLLDLDKIMEEVEIKKQQEQQQQEEQQHPAPIVPQRVSLPPPSLPKPKRLPPPMPRLNSNNKHKLLPLHDITVSSPEPSNIRTYVPYRKKVVRKPQRVALPAEHNMTTRSNRSAAVPPKPGKYGFATGVPSKASSAAIKSSHPIDPEVICIDASPEKPKRAVLKEMENFPKLIMTKARDISTYSGSPPEKAITLYPSIMQGSESEEVIVPRLPLKKDNKQARVGQMRRRQTVPTQKPLQSRMSPVATPVDIEDDDAEVICLE